MPGGMEVEKSEEEKKRCISDLRKLMWENELLKNLKSDDPYLERFLYSTNFDVEEAFKKLKMFYELLEECPEWFSTGCPEENKSIIDKHIRILPQECDKDGRPIYIVKLANMDYTMDLVNDIVPVDDFFIESLEITPAKYGLCVLIDVANFSWKLMRWLTPFNIRIVLRRVMTMPVKEYRYHIINNSFLVNSAIKIIWPFLPQQLKDSVLFHFNDYDSLYRHVEQDVLPVEYGGKRDSNYGKYHLTVYEKNSQIAESFKINRTVFLENMKKNKEN